MSIVSYVRPENIFNYIFLQVTLLTPFEDVRKHKNVKSVIFDDNDNSAIIANSNGDGLMAATLNVMEKGPSFCFSALSAKSTTSVLAKKYDLVFVSVFFNECFLGALHSMKVGLLRK